MVIADWPVPGAALSVVARIATQPESISKEQMPLALRSLLREMKLNSLLPQ
jgi:hypothetical protein